MKKYLFLLLALVSFSMSAQTFEFVSTSTYADVYNITDGSTKTINETFILSSTSPHYKMVITKVVKKDSGVYIYDVIAIYDSGAGDPVSTPRRFMLQPLGNELFLWYAIDEKDPKNYSSGISYVTVLRLIK